jgi:hypothetical protein
LVYAEGGSLKSLIDKGPHLHGGYPWGSWTYMDDVRVMDARPPLEIVGPYLVHLPPVTRAFVTCDPLPIGVGARLAVRPAVP